MFFYTGLSPTFIYKITCIWIWKQHHELLVAVIHPSFGMGSYIVITRNEKFVCISHTLGLLMYPLVQFVFWLLLVKREPISDGQFSQMSNLSCFGELLSGNSSVIVHCSWSRKWMHVLTVDRVWEVFQSTLEFAFSYFYCKEILQNNNWQQVTDTTQRSSYYKH